MTMFNPPHPGKMVKAALIEGAGLSVTEAAKRLGVTRPTLSHLINGKSSLSAEMALRLSMLLNTSIDMWLNAQSRYDRHLIEKKRKTLKIQPLTQAWDDFFFDTAQISDDFSMERE